LGCRSVLSFAIGRYDDSTDPSMIMPRPRGHFGIARSVRLSVPWRSCLGHRHSGCLQLSHRRPPEKCGLRTRPRTDVDPTRFLPPSNCHRRETLSSRRHRGDTLLATAYTRRPASRLVEKLGRHFTAFTIHISLTLYFQLKPTCSQVPPLVSHVI